MRKTHSRHCHKSFSHKVHNCQNEKKIKKIKTAETTQFPSPSPSPSSPSMDLPSSKPDGTLDAFSTVSSSTRVFWNSRRRSGSKRNLDKPTEDANHDNSNNDTPKKQDDDETMQDSSILSERRRALFEPLEPLTGAHTSAESLLPPPDFDAANYPRGWLIGKKRKLVNVDVVESMRRIAVQEMNRKDREINGLNEQLEDDSRCLEHLQIQLLQERSKRAEVERENSMLKEQLSMLMNMLQENEAMVNEGTEEN